VPTGTARIKEKGIADRERNIPQDGERREGCLDLLSSEVFFCP